MVEFLRKIWHSLNQQLSAILRFGRFGFIRSGGWRRFLLITCVAAAVLAAVFAYGFGASAEQAAGASTTACDDIGCKILMLFNNILFYICQMLGWVALKIFAIIVLISTYNEFVTSAAVTKGWALLRDVCNMLLVVSLLAIAFAMILRVKNYGSTQMLFAVVKAAVLINFSKLICGLIIDFAQVVMMTFVNGYAATAGANLVEGLGLSKLLAFGESGGAGAIGPFDIFLTLWVAIFILIMTIIVTFFILLLLLLRIVQLWILVVMSPIAFTVPAVPVKKFQSYGSQWWNTFIGTVAVGPLMAFFLWLSLLVMSNPQDLMIADTTQLEAKSGGPNKMGATAMQPMIQAAIGLVMLLAGLMVAKEAGGVVGSMGSKFADSATKAAKSIGGKMTGYSQVKERGVAAYKGWEGQAKKKKEMAMAKYGRFGEATFAKKEGAIGLGSKMVTSPVATVKAAGRAIKNKLEGKPTDFMGDMRKASGAGRINDIVRDSIEQDHAAKRQAEAEKSLDARGIKKPDDLRNVMTNTAESKDVRKAAALKLKGDYKSADEVKMAKDLIAGDRKSAKEFDDAMDKEQAHLAYDKKDPEQMKKFIEKLQKGKITLGSQKEDFFLSPEHLKAAEAALGSDRFNAQMQGVVKKGSIVHQDAVKGTLKDFNNENSKDQREKAVLSARNDLDKRGVHDGKDLHREAMEAMDKKDFNTSGAAIRKMFEMGMTLEQGKEAKDLWEKGDKKGYQAHMDSVTKGMPVGVDKTAETTAQIAALDKSIDERNKVAKPMRSAMATVTSDLSQVFATKDAAGNDDVMHDELQTHLKYASGKDLAKKDIIGKGSDPKRPLADKVLEDLAAVVSKKQLKEMASAKTEGAAPKVEIIIKQILESYNEEKAKPVPDVKIVAEFESRLTDIASQSAITDCVSDATVQKALAPFVVAPTTKPKPKRRTATGGSSKKKGGSGGGGGKGGKKKTP